MSEPKPEVVTRALVQDVQLPADGGTLALITLDNGHDHTKPNTFGLEGMAGLSAAVATLQQRAEAGEIVAVAVTGKPFIFAVGADLSGVPGVASREQALEIARAGHAAYAAVMDLPVPTFAFVNGAAMGGGVELSLACDYRTMSKAVPAIALPEVFLGLVPGWGGCYLLPRLVGPEKALKVIVENPLNTNRMLNGPAAAKLGLADALLDGADFLEQSIIWAAGVLTGETKVEREPVSDDAAVWEAAAAAATQLADAKTAGKSPSPYRAIELVTAARTAERDAAFAAEDEALADLLMGDELRAGLYSFDLVQKRAKRPAGAPDKSLARPVGKVGIVGAGLMASQLAMLFIRSLKVPVLMTDLDQERVDKGVAYVHGEIDSSLAKGKITQDKANQLKALITGSTSKEGFADADFVIEAVFEEMGVKKKVWAEVEQIVTPECILASNTSSLSITEMASELQHPERVVGFHFFNPVAVMPLLEIIPGEKTDDAALATAFATGKGLKKTCILVKDSPSFIANRLLGRFMGEFSKIVDEGTPVEVANEGIAGLAPMPPLVLVGLVGPAIALHNSETLRRELGERFYVSPNLKALVEAGKRSYDDEGVAELLTAPESPVELSAQQVRERVLGVLAEEVRTMLDDGVAQAPMDIDLAMITGAGFQFWNGGLTPLLDREGVSEKVTGQRFLPKGVASVPA
ncbi:3-hydroxyacyl-CoA dehydrogenase NAD-binding domain-containing protein [Janibacter anophelis]|uniref:3-hydroxyacyl-CoA dehydrogenase NAD-binding domain-containing protein n=1 Tax=Janibacter anophelis TaxID=319054 RepID=UPI000DEF3CB0|nr:3-hydroxyacyl-CoA dehydrogenase NAD-binding domain-containing protein [Janibacter anophelis]